MRLALVVVTLLALAPVASAATDFVPGDTIYLTPRPAGPVVLSFEGVPDMKMKFKLKQSGDSDVIAAMTLVSPTGLRRALGTASTKGKLKVKPVLDEAGTWSLEVTSADGSSGDAKLKTSAEIPTKYKEKIDVPAVGAIDFPFYAIAGAALSVKLKGDAGPQLDTFDGPVTTDLTLASPEITSKKVVGSIASAPETGRYVLGVSVADGPGRVKVRVKVKTEEGDADIDLRVTADASNLLGVYQGGVLDMTGSADALFALMTGAMNFDGAGGFTHTMEDLSIVEDATAPGGFRLDREIPGGAVPGLFTLTDGVVSLDFDPASGLDETAEMDVLLGGQLLLPRPEPGAGAGTGFLARRADDVSKGDLDGDYLYIFVDQSIEGTEPDAEVVLDLEIGLLQLDGKGSIGLGGGLKMKIVLDPDAENGFRQESSEAVLALGNYATGSDGEVTFNIRRELFGFDYTAHTLTALRDGLLLYAGGVDDNDRIHAKFMMALGTDETTADGAGSFRHYGTRVSTVGDVQTSITRSGTLVFDGVGGFSGTEAVSQTVTDGDLDPVITDLGEQVVTGTYAIQSFDLTTLMASLLAGGGTPDLASLDLPLTLTFAGETARTGVVTAGVDMMLAFSLEENVGFDLLVRE